MKAKYSPLEKEWQKVEKQEQLFLQKRMKKRDSKLNQFLEQRVPENLQNTLDSASSNQENCKLPVRRASVHEVSAGNPNCRRSGWSV